MNDINMSNKLEKVNKNANINIQFKHFPEFLV